MISAVQFKASKGDWETSAARLSATILDIAPPPPDGRPSIIVCPEMALTGYVFANSDAAREVAEPADGRTLAFAADLAVRKKAYVAIGYPESDGARLFNSCLIVDPDGKLVYNYRKRMLYETDESWALPGDTPYPIIETPLGRLTCGICMDLNDEDFIEFLFESSPDLIAFPTNWLDQGFDVREYWRWRLAGYPGWLIAANTYGDEDGLRFRGRSAILDPDGYTAALAPPSGDTVISVS